MYLAHLPNQDSKEILKKKWITIYKRNNSIAMVLQPSAVFTTCNYFGHKIKNLDSNEF